MPLLHFAVFFISIVLTCLQAQTALAVGEEYSRQADDLVVSVDSRWAGCGHGGYYPIRIKVANRGVDRDVTFRFARQATEAVPLVQRSIRLAQNATARVTLSVPCVGNGTYGTLNVYSNGRLVKKLSETLTLPDNQAYSQPRPSLLIISPVSEDADAFETAVTSLQSSTSASSAYGYGYYGYITEDHQVIGPELLPTTWLDYSGLDFVAVPLRTLASLAADERGAILKWVHCGGSLFVYEVGESAAASTELSRLLELERQTATAEAWQPADLSSRSPIVITETDEYGNIITAEERSAETGGAAAETSSADAAPDFLWPDAADAFAQRSLLMGKVYAFPGNPFKGTPHDWAWLLKGIPREQQTWTARHGISARRGSDEFLKFLIPSVKGVPVFAFLLLITLFTLLIGPLNYFWLWRKRMLYLLVITIPAIALATSLTLFAYSAVAHGFGTRSRARTLTYIDQKSNTAVALSRVSLFSGLAPSGGLRFSPETAVYPIWPEDGGFVSGAVDWTEQQTLAGWLRSRTRTQFLTVTHRDERGRIRVSPPSDGRMTIENGLAWSLAALLVTDEQGNLYFGKDIPAGASAVLTSITEEQRSQFADLLKRHPLHAPSSSGGSRGFFDWGFNSYYMGNSEFPVHYEGSLLEQQLQNIEKIGRGSGDIESASYAAVLNENPGIDYGVARTREEDSLHVLLGKF